MNALASRIKAITRRVKAIEETYADYADVSQVTATAADVASGKTFVGKDKTLVTGTAEEVPDGNGVVF